MHRGYMTMEGKSGFKTLTTVVLTEFLRTRSEVQQDKKSWRVKQIVVGIHCMNTKTATEETTLRAK